MMSEGLRLMAVGMFTVFAFLILLVVMMRASAAFFEANAHLFPEEAPDAGRSGNDEELAVVLALVEAARRGQRVSGL
ncbi:MAG: hypothetical protein CL908_09465 [Deltaproteobacteria bacterium]|jgi:Na+-transporting methylmalonyl-CoA/oxaloacetate decarboxylase gamma subunit|nr:hypothetical protein [Deltaproteobacteria bacterium]